MDTTITLGRTHHTVHIGDANLSRHVRGITVEADAGRPARIELDLSPLTSRIDAHGAAAIDDRTAVTLQRLGWTPPANADHTPAAPNQDGDDAE